MKLYTLALAGIASMCISAGGTTSAPSRQLYSKPDFAYPKQVEQQARINMDQAAKGGDTKALLRSLINLSLAESAITPDNLPEIIDRIKRLRAPETDPALRSLLDILLAGIYNEIYTDNRSAYDERPPMIDSKGSGDYRQWSGNQIIDEIISLIDRALTEAPTLRTIPVTEYDGVLNIDRQEAEVYNPTLLDFEAQRAADILRSLRWGNTAARTRYGTLISFMESQDVANPAQSVYWKLQSIENPPEQIDQIKKLYETYVSLTPASADLLTLLSEHAGRDENAGWLYSAAENFISRYPGYYRLSCVKNVMTDVSARSVRINAPLTVYPGTGFDIKASSTNVGRFTLSLWKVPDNVPLTYNYITNSSQRRSLVKMTETEVNIPDVKVPFKRDTTVTLPIGDPGRYVVKVTFDGSDNRENSESQRIITCSRLTTFTSMMKSRDAYVVDAHTGAPVPGASLSLLNEVRRMVTTNKIGTTDNNGFHRIANDMSGMLLAAKGSDRSPLQNIWRMSEPRVDKPVRHIEGYTSLPLYHPGDTLNWCAVAYEATGYSHRLLSGCRLTATLRDANYQDVDTMVVTTDSWGRVSASTIIPKDRMTGRYSLKLAKIDDKDKMESMVNVISFEVSDYKLPTYQVIMDPARPAAEGAYKVSGVLRTYAGMNLGGCEVSLDLCSAAPYFRWRSSSPQSFFTASVRSADDGSFSFTIPAERLDSAPYPAGIFIARITAVSDAGESESATVNFARRPVCLIAANLGENIDISRPVQLNISATEIDGKPVNTAIVYRIADDGRCVSEGTIAPGQSTVDWSSVPPGRYDISFSAPAMPESEPFVAGHVYLYKPADAPSPSKAPVWSPENMIETDANGHASMLYATPAGDSHVLASLWDPESATMIEQKWHKVSGGMNRLHFSLPDNVSRARITLTSTRDFKTESIEADVRRPDPRKEIVITTTSMRDKTSPLAKEQWTFTLKYADGTPVEGAMIMNMYSKAIDKLASGRWSMNAMQGNLAALFIGSSNYGSLTASARSATKWLDCPGLALPQWQMWGRSFINNGMNVYYSASQDTGGIRIRGAAKLNVVREHRDQIEVEEVLTTVQTTEMKLESAADTDGAEAGETAAAGLPEEIQYRPAEIPLAFFKPDLTTDKDGSLTISFTVPNAITTWQLNALAYTSEMLTATMGREIVCSKPLMIQPNLPRFVRSGDTVEIRSTIFNQSDSILDATVTASVTDAASGRSLSVSDAAVSIPAGGSRVVSLPVDVTLGGGSALTCRVSASSGRFTDGEQAMIPVLTSEASLIESKPFYLHTDSASVTVEVPEVPSDASMTLQYCENPLWMAVLALPSLSESNASTAPEAAGDLLMSLSAKNIIAQYPVIAEAIRRWNDSDRSDAALTAMLQRNPELKQLMLESTPWVRQAANDAERMSRLAMLLDGDNVDNAINQSIAKLKSLQTSQGGWKWMSGSNDASFWATSEALELIGSLNELGWMPDDREFTDMVRRAVSYLDSEIAARYKKWPRESYLSYALLRDMFPFTQPSDAHLASNAALREARDGWKNMSAVDKARVAVLLENHGYGDVSRQILTSLSEYAQRSPERGIWWEGAGLYGQIQILNAYTLLKPKSSDIDLIRQWIIFEKEAQDWGNTPMTSRIVAGLLTSSPSWVVPAKGVTVTLGQQPLATPDADYASGFFTMPVKAADASGKTLTINHEKGMPSWGAIVSQYERKATAVKAHPISGLSLDKALLVAKPGSDGQKWDESADMPLGSQVKVRLTLKCDRDMDYVSIVDQRGACLEPKDQLPGYIYSQNLGFYRENRDSETRIFIDHLPKGTYVLTYDVAANNAGSYSGGVATVQSQMTPSLTAHSAGQIIKVTSD